MAFHPRALSQWANEVSTHLEHLSKPQAMALALYSFGTVLVQSCGISSITCVLGVLLDQPDNTLRQRLREVTYEADAKRGSQRQASMPCAAQTLFSDVRRSCPFSSFWPLPPTR